MRFRGREIVYCQTVGLEAMNKIASFLEDDAVILQSPRMEGRPDGNVCPVPKA